jgi:hypothetical protein
MREALAARPVRPDHRSLLPFRSRERPLILSFHGIPGYISKRTRGKEPISPGAESPEGHPGPNFLILTLIFIYAMMIVNTVNVSICHYFITAQRWGKDLANLAIFHLWLSSCQF